MYAPPDAHFLACCALQWTVKMPVETADTEHGTALLRAPPQKKLHTEAMGRQKHMLHLRVCCKSIVQLRPLHNRAEQEALHGML